MKKTDVAWLAGLLETKGGFGLAPDQWGGRPYIAFYNGDDEVVKRVATLWARKVRTRYYDNGWSDDPVYSTTISGRSAAALMRRLYPLMGGRNQRRLNKIFKDYSPGTTGRKQRSN